MLSSLDTLVDLTISSTREISGVTTANDDIDFSAKAGVKFTF